jgi:hypothetical protein
MADLVLAATAQAVLCASLFALGRRAGRGAGRRVAMVVVASCCVLLVTYGWLRDSFALAWAVPVSSAVVLANFSLPVVAFLAGYGTRVLPGGPGRRGVLLSLLVAVAVWKAGEPFAGERPVLRDTWVAGVCMQSTEESCSAAAAATLLAGAGIAATERETADLALTTTRGTTTLGVYRALSLKTAGTDRRVRVLLTRDVGELRAAVAADGPVLLRAGLGRWQRVDPRYTQQWGWTPGGFHSVLVTGFGPGDKVWVIDPKIGREAWDLEALHTLWHGGGFQLVRR